MKKREYIDWVICSVNDSLHIGEIKHGDVGTSFSKKCSQMEAVTRALWGVIALYCSGDYEADGKINYEEIKKRIVAGIDPENIYYWGSLEDYGHQAVEMIPIALYLYICKKKSWDTFSEIERKKIIVWLKRILYVKLPNNNWNFFKIITVQCLYLLEVEKNPLEVCKKEFNNIESLYLGNGWYSDGTTKQRDYYVAFAFHFYSLLYVLLAKNDKENPFREIYENRSKQFAKQFIYWFASDGASVPFGRSLIYRHAHVAFWSVLELSCHESGFSKGQIKGIIGRNFEWWKKKDSNSYRKLQLGYTYPNASLAEDYNGIASSYWCLKSALILWAGDDFWNAEEEKLPLLNDISVQKEGFLTLTRNKNGNHIIAFMNGQESANLITNCAAKYGKFAYSSLLGFSVSRSNINYKTGAYDSTLAISLDNKHFYTRDQVLWQKQYENYCVSEWSPMREISITTYLIPGNPMHIRIHQIKSKYDCYLYDGGFCVDRENVTIKKSDSDICINSNGINSDAKILFGKGICEKAYPDANTSIYFPRSVYPYLYFKCDKGCYTIITSFSADVNDSRINKVNIETVGKTVSIKGDKLDIVIQLKNLINDNGDLYISIREIIKRIKKKCLKVLTLNFLRK